MDPNASPCRSVLYIPGSNDRAMEKAVTLPADGIIFDLEDAVAPDAKASARTQVARTLGARDYGLRTLMVRINGFETSWWEDDLAAICATGPAAILLPKVGSGADVRRLATYLEAQENCADTAIWAMMETPLAILNAADIASASPRLCGMVLGTNDLAKDLGSRETPERAELITSLSICLLAARAYGLVCIDGVYNRFQDEKTLERLCEQGRDMGFDGKSLIHPAQIEVANRVFAPSNEEIDLARKQIAAFDAASDSGQGIAVLDGNIVENLHVASARRLLARLDAIAAMG